MPMTESEVQGAEDAWVELIAAYSKVHGYPQEFGMLEQFWDVRDQVLRLAVGKDMLEALRRSYVDVQNHEVILDESENQHAQSPLPSSLVVQEWRAYPRAVRKFEQDVAGGKPVGPMRGKLLRVAKIVFGSSKDFFEKSPYGNGIVSVLKEMAEVFE